QYANFEPQLNIDAWRIKNQFVWSKEDNHNRLTSNYLYAERGLNSIKSRIYIGSGYFPLRGFDSFKFQGGVLKTDESMYPSIEKKFSPVVKGIAKSQSKVEIYQDKTMIYTTTVPAGPFEITDYLLSGSNSDLYVKVIDTYGNTQTFIVPYSLPAIAVRNGYRYYEIAAGNYQELDEDFANFYSIIGLPYDFTVYGGAELSSKYNSINMGLGKIIGDLGAVSYAVTASKTNIKSSKVNNTSWNVKYNKHFNSIGAFLSLYYSNYSPDGFYSLKDYFFYTNKNEDYSFYNKKNDYGVSLTLPIGATLNLGAINYWSGHKSNSYTLSYTSPLFNGSAYFNTSITQNHMYNNKKSLKDTIVNAGVSIPFSLFSGNQQVAISSVVSNNRHLSNNFNISGNSKDNKAFWNVSQEYNNAETNASVSSLLGGYKGKYAKLSGGYIKSNKLQRVNGSLDGSFLLYKNGIVLGNSSGDTIAVIEAPGASNARINGLGGGETNYFGYALASYLEPYRENRISMDPLSLPSDISLDFTSTSVIPTKGAFIPAKFKTNRGKKVLLNLEDEYGNPIPFGAIVRVVSDSDNMSIVGDDGVVYLTAMKDTGVIEV
ncbi:TPA: fimbrial biogenesis outer membrane usher protein, partial [Escherichia coli]|nr:fimbrial biogenesis outer membrane usher protein [Escherichia coli]